MAGLLGFIRGRNNSFCKLNLRMDGANDDTTITDTAAVGAKTITNVSSRIKLKTATKKFGTASALFTAPSDGNCSYATIPANADFAYGTADYTIETAVNSTG